MSIYLNSPGTTTPEIDQSFRRNGISDESAFTIIGLFEKGPRGIPVRVTSQSQLVNTFGDNNVGFYGTTTALKALEEKGDVYVTRILPGDASDAILEIPLSGSSDTFIVSSRTSGKSGNTDWEVIITQNTDSFNLDVVRYGTSGDQVPVVLESFPNLVFDPDSVNFIGRRIGTEREVLDTVNNVVYTTGDYPLISQFIRVDKVEIPENKQSLLAEAGIYRIFDYNGDPTSEAFITGSDGTFNANPKFGANMTLTNAQGLNFEANNTGSTSPYQAYIDAITLLSNSDEYDVEALFTPGIIHELGGAMVPIIEAGIQMSQERGDVLYVFDLHKQDTRNASTIAVLTSGYDTSYGAVYAGWPRIYDNRKQKFQFVPNTVLLPKIFAFSDNLSDPWIAPAGLTRGGIPDARSTTVKWSAPQRNTLYNARVNPIAQFPGEGVVVWGQKTLQKRASALDRVNVRRLLIRLKKFFTRVGNEITFENNTTLTRTRFLDIVNPYMERVQERQGLTEFRVIMDETNNPGSTIDRNEIRGDVYIEPSRSGEFVRIPFTVLPTGTIMELDQ